jgi:hypothetical protein
MSGSARARRSTREASDATTAGPFARACPLAQNPPCAAGDPGYTNPLTDYGRGTGQVITAAAFIPNGHWPAEYDGGYLFADAGSGNMWLRTANGNVNYATPFATNVGGIADMAFVTTNDSIALYYTLTGGAVRKISRPPTAFVDPGPLAFVAVPPGTQCSTAELRLPATSGFGPTPRATSRWASTLR